MQVTTRKQRLVLGVIDHGTRACLRLTELGDKRSLSILVELIAAMRRFGLPRTVRTDNEACFVSRTMKLALALLGVRMQRTDVHCPWQNGRIERGRCARGKVCGQSGRDNSLDGTVRLTDPLDGTPATQARAYIDEITNRNRRASKSGGSAIP